MSHVDVMVVCYNYGRFLRECVESVLAQSHTDLRVVIVDDASTDDTPVVCSELMSKDRRVEVVRHAINRGHIRTYNECIDLARDEYMLLLSADDYLLPGALARAVAVLDAEREIGLVHGAWFWCHEDGTVTNPNVAAPSTEIVDRVWLIERLAIGNYIHTATAVVRTSVQKTLGGYRLELPHTGDLDMWLRFALHGNVAYVAERQAAYRRHDRNMSLNYQICADLQQCVQTFQYHYQDIRRRMPNGLLLEARVRQLVARKMREVAHELKRDGQIRPAFVMRGRSIQQKLHSRMLTIRAGFDVKANAPAKTQ
jgi:glycosyltransferase involved in cell wall biosynthesis